MRALSLAAALAASTAACCYDPSDACVVGTSHEVCRDIDVAESCGDEPARAPLSSCYGTLHTWEDCADLGFTVRCSGYSVRPGEAC